MWSTMLALLCGAGLVAGAPQGLEEGRSSSSLPVEHRTQEEPTADFFGELFDEMLKSETASAVDEVASHFTRVVGGIVDNIGEFVVGGVKDLPDTIDRISERVGDAVQNGEETVVIIVKGVRNTVGNLTNGTGDAVVHTVDQVFNHFNQSKTLTSMQELEKSIRLSIARIGASIIANMGNIDSAVAQGIRTVTRSGEDVIKKLDPEDLADSETTFRLPQEPPAVENEVRSL